MECVEYWIWLQNVFSPGSPKPAKLLEAFGGAGEIYAASRGDYLRAGGLTAREIDRLCDKSLDLSEKTVENCMRNGYTVVTLHDSVYPRRLADIYAPPAVLYCWGTLPEQERLSVAVVGTRRLTEYGRRAAALLSEGIAGAGAVVVSGLALGADTAAHTGALRAGGLTVAVIGCGIDYDYPVSNRELKREIAAHGAVISEYPPGTRPDRIHFPIRNRIIAGICAGTLVIEAGIRSGSLITAALAAEEGRDVFAVPGGIFSPMSEGTNRLIRDGAKPAVTAGDVLEEYMDLSGWAQPAAGEENPPDAAQQTFFAEKNSAPAAAFAADGAHRRVDNSTKITHNVENEAPRAPSGLPREPGEAPTEPRAPAGLSAAQQKIYEILLGGAPAHVDEIALRTGLELRVVLAALTALEIRGLARSYPGRRYAGV